MKNIIYRKKGDELVKGTYISLLLKDEWYHLVDLKIYADGYMDCLGSIDMPELKRHFKSGKLSWKMPPDERLFIPYIGYISTTGEKNHEYPDERLFRIIEKLIEELRIGESIELKCAEAFKHYLVEPSESSYHRLKDIYSQVPAASQERGIMEYASKDPLIRLMKTGEPIPRELREYYLLDYFQGEWLEMK